MPIQVPQWADYLNCPACCREFAPPRSPISLGCGHTLCKICINNLHRKQCPFDQTEISVELGELVVNTALLQLAGFSPPAQPARPPCVQALPDAEVAAYDLVVKCLEQLAVFLKCCGNANVNGSRLSRPMQRKLVSLLQCAITDEDGRGKAARAARSLGERTVTELLLQHQNPQQLSANLWAAVRSRGCQFLGPAMQEEVLKLVILALEDGSALSRKVLVMFVVQRLEPHFPQASKTSIGHVVQLLYRASCFMVSKRERDSSLMQLKEEFRTYEALRREHDAQIVQIATEAGLRIAPDQWSALLYGDTQHKSHMQSIIDKLQTPQSFAQSVQELIFALQRTGDPAQLIVMNIQLDRLASIDASPDAKSPDWLQLAEIMTSLKEVVSGLVKYMQHLTSSRDANHNSTKILERLAEPPVATPTPVGVLPGRYKVAMCRDAQNRTYCPRGNNCTYAHSEEELERYRMGHVGIHPMPISVSIASSAPVIRPIYSRYSGPPPPPIMPVDYNIAPVPYNPQEIPPGVQHNPQDMPRRVQYSPQPLPPGVQYNPQDLIPGVQYGPQPLPPGVRYMPQEMPTQQQYTYDTVQIPMPPHKPTLEHQHQNGGNVNYSGSYANDLIHGNNNAPVVRNVSPAHLQNGNPPVYYRTAPYYYRYPQATDNGDDPSNIWVVPPARVNQGQDTVIVEYPRDTTIYAGEAPAPLGVEDYPQTSFEGFPSQTYEEFGQAVYDDDGQIVGRRCQQYNNWPNNLILGMDNLQIGEGDLAEAINDERELEKELLALEERITTDLAKGSDQDFKGEK